MKVSITGMLFILIALTVGPLVYFNGGAAYIDSFFSQNQPTAKLKLNKDVVYAPVTTDEKVKVYKWKDENGIWQFGSVIPPGLAGAESMILQPNVNIMKSIEVPGQEQEGGRSGVVSLGADRMDKKSSKDKRDNDGVGISQESLDNPYAPESISELINSSKNIQNVLDKRQQQQLSNESQ